MGDISICTSTYPQNAENVGNNVDLVEKVDKDTPTDAYREVQQAIRIEHWHGHHVDRCADGAGQQRATQKLLQADAVGAFIFQGDAGDG